MSGYHHPRRPGDVPDVGIFSEFEREMIVARVNAGIARTKEAIEAAAVSSSGTGILKTAKLVGLGTGAVQRLKPIRQVGLTATTT